MKTIFEKIWDLFRYGAAFIVMGASTYCVEWINHWLGIPWIIDSTQLPFGLTPKFLNWGANWIGTTGFYLTLGFLVLVGTVEFILALSEKHLNAIKITISSVLVLIFLSVLGFVYFHKSNNRQANTVFEPLNAYELDKMSAFTSVMEKRLVTDIDLNNLREAIKSYVGRTGHAFTKSDIENLTGLMSVADEYQYELAQSLLFSWDNHQAHTTNRFDELYKEFESEGGRKPELLKSDKYLIQAAANNLKVIESDGNKYKFGREIILNDINMAEITEKNCQQMIAVYDEFVK